MTNPFSRVRQFYRETVIELKRASWPNFKEVRGSMVMVFVSLALLGAFVALADFSIYNVVALFSDIAKSK